MKNLLIPILVAAGLSAILLASCRHGGACGHGSGARDAQDLEARLGGHIEKMTVKLQATPEQRAAILSARDRLLPEVLAFLAGGGEVRVAFLAAWQAEKPDAAAVDGLIDRRAEAARALGHKLVVAALEIRESLAPDQRAKVAEWIEKHGRR